MLAAERHSIILDQLKKHKTVTVSDLSHILEVSEVTIRKDLIKLENEGHLSRIHGGATTTNFLPMERSFTEKLEQRMEEKQAIARQALKHIHQGDTIMLGVGTTTMELAKLLKPVNDLTIVTNAVNIAMELNTHGNHNVILVGGEMRLKSYALVGAVAEDSLKKLSVFKCFLGTDGIHLDNGITTLALAEGKINRVMMERSRKVYILADHTKFGETYLTRFADLADVDRIITDRLDEETYNKFVDQGVNIEVASGSPQ
ncbi:MAG: DeoR/GlpR family DNA-binding transcription regulator [Clostridia bacterium]